MEYKILEANGIENENVDGAAFNNFVVGGKNAILKGVLNECALIKPSSNSFVVSSGVMIIQGIRIKILEEQLFTMSGIPAISESYQLVARVRLEKNRNVEFSLFVVREDVGLTQDRLFEQEQGVYEERIARFTYTPEGTIEGLTATLPTIMNSVSGGGAIIDNTAIIDVEALPTDNINEKAFYRMGSGTYTVLQGQKSTLLGYPLVVSTVDTLPAIGEPLKASITDPTRLWLYLQTSDMKLYAYIPQSMERVLGVSGWQPYDILYQLDEETPQYEVVDSVDEIENPDEYKLYVIYNALLPPMKLFQYKDGWHEVGSGVANSNSEGGGQQSPAIIDVEELPTENIDEHSFYRIGNAAYTLYRGLKNNFVGMPLELITVKNLPSEGKAVFDSLTSPTRICGYFQTSDLRLYVYVPFSMAEGFGASGWLPYEMLTGGIDNVAPPYQHVNTEADIVDINAHILYVVYDSLNPSVKLYHYKDGWFEVGADSNGITEDKVKELIYEAISGALEGEY